jgi:hypothetical protein
MLYGSSLALLRNFADLLEAYLGVAVGDQGADEYA